jgi:hypothetical protein
MIEPIKGFIPKHFSGKSSNHHPRWSKEPLRLTIEQQADALPVFKEFFECYHLHEVRDMLWNWTVEVLSSPNGISENHHERNNHLFFYQKIETLVEAVFVISKSIR